MKLAFFNDNRLGVILNGNIVDITPVVGNLAPTPQGTLTALIATWDAHAPKIDAHVKGQAGIALDAIKFRSPVPKPGQLVCAAVNYIEPNRPKAAFNAFLKSTSSIIAHQDTVELPPAEATVFHFEPELALVIGKRASRIDASDAMDYIFGYTQFMDVSARGLGGFFLGKSWHTCGPLGPALVTADEIDDPNQLPVKMWVNNQLNHDFSTSSMNHHIPELLAQVTGVMTLEPGDVLATGTHHEGLAPVQNGDEVRLQIERLGPVLTVQVHDSLKRSW